MIKTEGLNKNKKLTEKKDKTNEWMNGWKN